MAAKRERERRGSAAVVRPRVHSRQAQGLAVVYAGSGLGISRSSVPFQPHLELLILAIQLNAVPFRHVDLVDSVAGSVDSAGFNRPLLTTVLTSSGASSQQQGKARWQHHWFASPSRPSCSSTINESATPPSSSFAYAASSPPALEYTRPR